jgi:hypothetical protein
MESGRVSLWTNLPRNVFQEKHRLVLSADLRVCSTGFIELGAFSNEMRFPSLTLRSVETTHQDRLEVRYMS